MYIQKGEYTRIGLQNLLGEKGIIITEIQGMRNGIDISTGDFSFSARGYIKKKNNIEVVNRFILTGNIIDLFKSIIAVGNDLKFGIPNKSCFGSPSVVFSKVYISSSRSRVC